MIEYKHKCDICDKLLDFENINEPKEEALMINYYDPLVNDGCVVIICSNKCYKNYIKIFKAKGIIPGCVNCQAVCESNKWSFELKFINQGGWTSIKYMCSEKCKKEFHKEVKKDEELGPCYQCAFCKKYTKNKMLRCSRCKINYYCDQNCQKSDWNKHKIRCRQ